MQKYRSSKPFHHLFLYICTTLKLHKCIFLRRLPLLRPLLLTKSFNHSAFLGGRFFARASTALASCINKQRKYLSPRLLMPSNFDLPPDECCLQVVAGFCILKSVKKQHVAYQVIFYGKQLKNH